MPDERGVEVYTGFMHWPDGKRLYFSGRRLRTSSGKEYVAIQAKDGRISRGVDGAYVESFGNRSQPAKAVEAAFQEALENGNLMAEVMDREMADAALVE